MGLALLVVVVCLSFAAFTGHMWEDYFITFRASLNLATGHGLVFQPGERVHTFTSPLGTLLPALFALGGGADVAERALWLFRVVSALALASAIGLAARTMQRAQVVPLALAAGCVAWALDPKTVDFSINGMETGFLVLFVVLTWHAFSHGARILPCALAFAGLQWTRPDGCVFRRARRRLVDLRRTRRRSTPAHPDGKCPPRRLAGPAALPAVGRVRVVVLRLARTPYDPGQGGPV